MNNNLKRAIVGSALLFSMGMASAETIDLSDGKVHTQFVTHTAGLFTDTFNFSILSASNVGSSVSNVALSIYGMTLLDIDPTSWNLKLSDSLGKTLSIGSTFAGKTLNSGTYTFEVTGKTIGLLGGSYAYAAVAAPVPEPSTWAMMLGGFGLIGFMSYRRRQYF